MKSPGVLGAALGVLGLLLGGCATDTPPEPKMVVQRVEIPVPVKCAADPGPAPAYVDSDEALKAAADIFEQVRLLLAGRKQRMKRENELTAANSGCR